MKILRRLYAYKKVEVVRFQFKRIACYEYKYEVIFIY